MKNKKHISIDKRIYALEKFFDPPPGTQLVRTLAPDKGTMWCIGFGQIMTPKTFFEGRTIIKAVEAAEKDIKAKGFSNDPWRSLKKHNKII